MRGPAASSSPLSKSATGSSQRKQRMARKRPVRGAGTIVMLEYRSKVLAENPLGDPHVRRLAVWLPPQYDRRRSGPGARFPVLMDMVGITGSGPAPLNWETFSAHLAERTARRIHANSLGLGGLW